MEKITAPPHYPGLPGGDTETYVFSFLCNLPANNSLMQVHYFRPALFVITFQKGGNERETWEWVGDGETHKGGERRNTLFCYRQTDRRTEVQMSGLLHFKQTGYEIRSAEDKYLLAKGQLDYANIEHYKILVVSVQLE